MKNKKKDWDDGRTVANMNVEGMPWYVPDKKEKTSESEPVELTKKETFAMMKGVLGASMLVALVFVVVFTLFILFCVFIWFK